MELCTAFDNLVILSESQQKEVIAEYCLNYITESLNKYLKNED